MDDGQTMACDGQELFGITSECLFVYLTGYNSTPPLVEYTTYDTLPSHNNIMLLVRCYSIVHPTPTP